MHLEIEELLEDAQGVLRSSDGVASSSGVGVDLVVVAALEGLVTEEVNGLVSDAIGLLGLVLEVLEAGGLCDVRKTEVAESLFENSDELLADLCVLVELLKDVSLLGAGVTADGANVDHAVAELDKGTALDGDVKIGDVVQDKVGELLVLLLANVLDEGV
ncbi:hypothetical protein HG530_002912 [Fusarium avenaceum]|nr:hypothetical protein HG530_002912 [Fusarium avenaceum]